MTVRAGREFLAVPGPTNIPDEVLQAMHRPAVEIYSEPLIALTDSLLHDMSKLFNTKGRTYIYIANGHGAWEAALTNVLSRGDKILVLENGRFRPRLGRGCGSASASRSNSSIAIGDARCVRRGRSAPALRQGRRDQGHSRRPGRYQLERRAATSRRSAHVIRAARHDALFMVDTVASLGCVPFAMDAWGVDVAIAGSQKGLMTPPA